MPPVVHFFQHGGKCSKVLRCDKTLPRFGACLFELQRRWRSVGFFPAKDIQHLGRAHCLFRSHDWSSLLHIKIVKFHLVSWILPSHKLCYVATGLRKGSWKMSPHCHISVRFLSVNQTCGSTEAILFWLRDWLPTPSGKFTHLWSAVNLHSL